jgi:cell division protein FtsN
MPLNTAGHTNRKIYRVMNKHTRKSQAGGFMLGLVLGTLLGLGAALAVAVYVAKVPIPFLTKGQSHGAENDAAEAKKNKDWDPNAILGGKNPARSSPSASGTLNQDSAAPAAQPPAMTAVPPNTVDEGKPLSTDPLGDLAKAKAAAKPVDNAGLAPATAAAESSIDPFDYFIQAGAFRTPEDAEQQRAKLSLLGFQAKVSNREQSGRMIYRVRLGPFDKKTEADKITERLSASSVQTALVRVRR